MDYKKIIYIFLFVLVAVLFVIVNLYKGTAYSGSTIFSKANVYKTLVFFLIGMVVAVLVVFLKNGKGPDGK